MSDTSQELEFAAEDTRVTIIPNFGHVKFTFISSECGPFEPGLPVEVPLWLALTLKRRLKCQVQPPEWLELEALRTALEKEKEGASFGENVPYHYLEIAAMLLNGAKDDIPNHDAIRTAVEDLKDIRQRKVRSGIRGIVGNEFGDTADGDVLKQVGGIAIKMRGIAAMEIHAMRDHFLLALERMQSLAMAEDELYRDEATAPGVGGGGGGGGGDASVRSRDRALAERLGARRAARRSGSGSGSGSASGSSATPASSSSATPTATESKRAALGTTAGAAEEGGGATAGEGGAAAATGEGGAANDGAQREGLSKFRR